MNLWLGRVCCTKIGAGSEGTNILYVENHERFAAVAVKTFLTEHAVTVVPSLVAARQALAQGRFALVLLDQDLDDGKGAELAAELTARPQRPFILAASSHRAGNEALLKAGADGVCSKLEFQGIAAAIANLSSTRRAV